MVTIIVVTGKFSKQFLSTSSVPLYVNFVADGKAKHVTLLCFPDYDNLDELFCCKIMW